MILNLANKDIVVHLASNTTDLSSNADITGIKALLKIVEQNKMEHFVFISIVGVDKVPIKYLKTKFRVEQLIKKHCKKHTILRSTQFLEFFEQEVQKI